MVGGKKPLRDKEYVLASERVYPDGSVVRSWVPVLTDEERARRHKILEDAARRFMINVEETRRQRALQEDEQKK